VNTPHDTADTPPEPRHDPPVLEVPAVSRIHLIGGEKGGVGKSMTARLLAQYFIDRNIAFTAYDTDRSHGALRRFYGDYASDARVDRYESLDAIVETAVEQPGRRVLVDLAAQTHEALTTWMDESGVLDLTNISGIALHYWHVMDSGRDSVDLLQRVIDRFGQRVHWVLVRNQLRGDDFSLLDRSGQLGRALAFGARTVDLKRLHDSVVQKIDASNSSFWAARHGSLASGPSLGLMERQRLKLWLAHAYGQIEGVAP
jgi:hypothetical protein